MESTKRHRAVEATEGMVNISISSREGGAAPILILIEVGVVFCSGAEKLKIYFRAFYSNIVLILM